MIFRYKLVTLIALIGITLSISSFFFAKNWEESRIRHQVERNIQNYASAITNTFTLQFELLHSITALYKTPNEISRKQFNNFTDSILTRYSGIQALE